MSYVNHIIILVPVRDECDHSIFEYFASVHTGVHRQSHSNFEKSLQYFVFSSLQMCVCVEGSERERSAEIVLQVS